MQAKFTTVGLIGKLGDPEVGRTIHSLSEYLHDRKLEVLLDEDTARSLPDSGLETAPRSEIGRRCDLAVVIGGDGTLLNAARSLADFGVLLVGINLGHLGFLTDISPIAMLEGMDQILQGHYQAEERFLLHCVIVRGGERVSECDAFNDVVVHKWNVARMIQLETYINGRLLNKLRSDGLIVSTPTGSTAYALSAGGPILHPSLNAIVIVPVCPHTMSHRPIVVESSSEIEIIVSDNRRDNAQVTCDGQITFALSAGDRITVRRKERPIKLAHLPQHDHYKILRAKLLWAENPKN